MRHVKLLCKKKAKFHDVGGMIIGVVDGKEKVECNACGQQYVIGGSKVGTSHLLRHVKLLCKKKKLNLSRIVKLAKAR